MRILFAFFWILSLLLISCTKKPTKTENIPSPQEHIPWPSLADSPWPMFRHDPQGTGRSQNRGPTSLQFAEVFPLNNTNGGSSPVLDERGNVYFSNASGFYAVTPNGDSIWIADADFSEDESTPIVSSDGVVYFAGLPGSIWAIRFDGTVKWKLETSEKILFQHLKVDKDGNLYLILGHQDRFLTKISSSGEVIFKIQDNVRWGYIHAFSVDGQTMYIWRRYVNTGPVLITAVDLNGNIRWERSFEGNVGSPLVVDSDDHILFAVGSTGGEYMTIYSLNADGSTFWSYEHGSEQSANYYPSGFSPTIDWDGNVFFLGVGPFPPPGELVSLTNEGKFRWSLRGVGGCSLICGMDNTMYNYFVEDDSVYYAAISNDGEIKWKMGGEIGTTNTYEPIIGFENDLYILSSNWGERYLYRVW